MKRTAITVALAGVVLTLAACNRADDNRTTSIEPGLGTAAAAGAIGGLSAPPAPAQRGPSIWDTIANAAGTETANVFADAHAARALPGPKGAAPEEQVINVRAQEAAAKAPDTASADAAKKKVRSEGAAA
jgi:hypothetical protein